MVTEKKLSMVGALGRDERGAYFKLLTREPVPCSDCRRPAGLVIHRDGKARCPECDELYGLALLDALQKKGASR